jgi:hypothetical protein
MGHAKTLIGRLALALLLLGLTSFTPARAISVIGKWDPSFGAAFPDLGWRGEATFLVPDACLGESGWVLNSDSCSAFGMKIISAEVEFYKLSDPTNSAFQETLMFSTPSSAVVSMELNGGLLEGVYGTFLYSRPSTLPLAGGGFTEFVLFFEGDLARMFYVSTPPGGEQTAGFSDRSPSDGSPFMTFRVVPEPMSLSLLGLGLLFTAWLARRSRAARAQAH